MRRLFGLLSVGIVIGLASYIYMNQAQNAMVHGASNPAGTVDVVGVRHDLMAIARAERSYSAMHSGYVSLDQLRSSGELSMGATSRGPYNYSVEVSGTGFRAVATYSGPESASVSRTISIDQDLHFSEE